MKETIEKALNSSIKAKQELLKTEIDNIHKSAMIIVESLNAGGKLLVFGNGGSAADSQHMAAELVGRFKKERKALPAIALTTNTSTITAIGNDFGFDALFSRQLEALAKPRDVAIGISTSGNSKNILTGIKKAREMGLMTIGITGGKGGDLKDLCDVVIASSSTDTPTIQESHITIIHILCELIENGVVTE